MSDTELNKALTELFMAGRKSMSDEIENEGRHIQLPIEAQIKPAREAITRHLSVAVKEARRAERLSMAEQLIDGGYLTAQEYMDFKTQVATLTDKGQSDE